MLKRRWMKKVLVESQKEKIELPWARKNRQRKRAALQRALSA